MINEDSPFFGDVIISTKDHPGVLSAVIFVDPNLCNLDCFGCYNKHSPRGGKMKWKSVIRQIDIAYNAGCKLLIVSGGEPTADRNIIHHIDLLRNYLSLAGIEVLIRIDTNGTRPSVVKSLMQYVAGFAVDVKIPVYGHYDFPNYGRLDAYREVIGFPSISRYRYLVFETVVAVSMMPYTIFRTVRYPQLTRSELSSIHKFISMYGKHVFLEFVHNG